MADLPDISRVPRKVWIGAVGIAAGATAIKVWKNRGGKDPGDGTQTATAVDANATSAPTYGALTSGTDYPVTGTTPLISPVVIQGGNEDGSGIDPGAVQGLYVDAVGGLLGAYEGLVGPLVNTQQQLLLGQNDALMGIIGAGGVPAAQGTPVVVAPPPPAPTATPIPTGAPAFKTTTRRVTRDNGKSGRARAVWCVSQTIHTYPNRPPVVVKEDKVKNGAC